MYSIDTYIYIYTHVHTNLLLKVSHPGIFPSTFLQPVNSSESYETPHYLHVFFFLDFETIFEDFPFYSPILLTLWFR